MKRNWRKVASLLIVLILTGLFVERLGSICAPVSTDMDLRAIRAFHSLPKDTMEVMIYGSSHSWNGVDTQYLYDKYGINAYNYSAHWQHINTTQLFFEDSLKTQSPKVAFFELFRVQKLKKDTPLDGEIYYTREIYPSIRKLKYLRQCFGWSMENYLSYYVPLWAFHDNWNSISERSFKKDDSSEAFIKTRGARIHDSVVASVNIKDAESKQKELPQHSVEVLDEIVATCEKNDIKPVFFVLPYSGPFKYGDAMKKYAVSHNCDFINFFDLLDEIGLDSNKDFLNKGHLNRSGATKVTDYLGKLITERYDCTDMRSKEGDA